MLLGGNDLCIDLGVSPIEVCGFHALVCVPRLQFCATLICKQVLLPCSCVHEWAVMLFWVQVCMTEIEATVERQDLKAVSGLYVEKSRC